MLTSVGTGDENAGRASALHIDRWISEKLGKQMRK